VVVGGIRLLDASQPVITLAMIREHLGERAAKKISAALRPRLDRELAESARRYVAGVPGDRIRRLKDRAAFAAAMVQLVHGDETVHRWALRLFTSARRDAKPENKRRARRLSGHRRSQRGTRKAA